MLLNIVCSSCFSKVEVSSDGKSNATSLIKRREATSIFSCKNISSLTRASRGRGATFTCCRREVFSCQAWVEEPRRGLCILQLDPQVSSRPRAAASSRKWKMDAGVYSFVLGEKMPVVTDKRKANLGKEWTHSSLTLRHTKMWFSR